MRKTSARGAALSGLQGPACQPFGTGVHARNPPCCVSGDHGVANRLQGYGEVFFAPLKLLLGQLAVSNVLDARYRPDDFAGRVPQWPVDCCRPVDPVRTLDEAIGADDYLARERSLQRLHEGVEQGGRQVRQHLGRFPSDDALCGQAGQLLHDRIPMAITKLGVAHGKAVGQAGDDLLREDMGFMQCRVGAFSCADVHVGSDHADRLAAFVALHHFAPCQDPTPFTSLVPQPVFEFIEGRIALQVRGECGLDLGQIVRMNQPAPAFESGFDLTQLVAEHRAPALVEDNVAAGQLPVPQAEIGPSQRQLEPLRDFAPFRFLGQRKALESLLPPLLQVQGKSCRRAKEQVQPAAQGRLASPRQVYGCRLSADRNDQWPVHLWATASDRAHDHEAVVARRS